MVSSGSAPGAIRTNRLSNPVGAPLGVDLDQHVLGEDVGPGIVTQQMPEVPADGALALAHEQFERTPVAGRGRPEAKQVAQAGENQSSTGSSGGSACSVAGAGQRWTETA